MNMIRFQFTKLYYTTKELLELIPIPRSTFYKMHREEIEAGRDGSDMGKVKNKVLTQKITYDYEKTEQEAVHVAIGVFNKNQKQLNKEIN
jgi:hypothetical protein